jgi:hypothetical protein
MSLVVARVVGGLVYLFADTELTEPDLKKRNAIVQGCLKLYRLSDTLAVGFAGNVDHFAATFAKLRNGQSAERIAEAAVFAQRNGADIEILVAEIGLPRVYTIRGGISTEAESAHIGDPDAFEQFQKNYHRIEKSHAPTDTHFQFQRLPEPIPKFDTYSQMFEAFERVVSDARVTREQLRTQPGQFRSTSRERRSQSGATQRARGGTQAQFKTLSRFVAHFERNTNWIRNGESIRAILRIRFRD